MIHDAFSKAEIAERYYRELNKFTTRERARKAFIALKKYDKEIIKKIMKEIHREQMDLLKK